VAAPTAGYLRGAVLIPNRRVRLPPVPAPVPRGGFQHGYLGPGAGVLVEWYPRDGVMVWLLPLSPGEVPVSWGGPTGPKGFELGFVAAAAGSQLDVRDEDVYSATDEALTALAGELRSSGQSMLRGDYAQVPAIKDLIRTRAEVLHKGQLYPLPGGRPEDRPGRD